MKEWKQKISIDNRIYRQWRQLLHRSDNRWWRSFYARCPMRGGNGRHSGTGSWSSNQQRLCFWWLRLQVRTCVRRACIVDGDGDRTHRGKHHWLRGRSWSWHFRYRCWCFTWPPRRHVHCWTPLSWQGEASISRLPLFFASFFWATP